MKDKLNNVAGWINTILILGALTTAGYLYKDFEGRMHDSTEQKVEHDNHIKSAPNDVDSYKALKRYDSATSVVIKNNKDAIRSRSERDSLMKVALDISNRNAITVFQMKQTVDTLNSYWREYNSENE
jgi:IS30 family transposase